MNAYALGRLKAAEAYDFQAKLDDDAVLAGTLGNLLIPMPIAGPLVAGAVASQSPDAEGSRWGRGLRAGGYNALRGITGGLGGAISGGVGGAALGGLLGLPSGTSGQLGTLLGGLGAIGGGAYGSITGQARGTREGIEKHRAKMKKAD